MRGDPERERGIACAMPGRIICQRGQNVYTYTFESRVRYSETDEYGRLSITGIMNYLQDTSTFQSEELGMGIQYLKEKKRAWWLSAWQLEIRRQPLFMEKIRISTWSRGFKGIYGYRNFLIEDSEGEPLVLADSTWFFYDLEHGCPLRVPEDQTAVYGVSDRELRLPPAPRKIVFSPGCRKGEPVTVGRHHLDTNQHVNNAQYVAIARELLPGRFSIGELRAEYKKAAVLGDVMYPELAEVPEGYVVALRDAEGNTYANVWLAEKREDE